MQQTGVLVLGHGSRARGVEDAMAQLAELVRLRLGVPLVQPAFLSFNRPDLAEGVAELVRRGARRVVVAPVFLSHGVHVQEDIPARLAEVRASYAGEVEIVAAGNLGNDPRVADIVADRVREVLGWNS